MCTPPRDVLQPAGLASIAPKDIAYLDFKGGIHPGPSIGQNV